MAEMKDFDVVRVARSDGADTGPGYWPVTTPAIANLKKPTKDAGVLEKTPRTKPQMIRLAEDDPRFVEWRVKLGILLKQELSPTPDEGSPWLVNFPRGYWLYEKSKHLWVSGYPIKGKLFKSPQEFALHLIWLLSASMAYRDCCCVHCNAPAPIKSIPMNDDSPAVIHEASPKVEKVPAKVTPVPLPTIPGQPPPKQQTPVPIPPPSQPPPQSVAPAKSIPAPAAPQTQTPVQPPQIQPRPQSQPQPPQQYQQHQQPQQLKPQPQQSQLQVQSQAQPQTQAPVQPQIQHPPQQHIMTQAVGAGPSQTQAQAQTTPTPSMWDLKSPFLFRTGELVWYQNGSTWRLGMIAVSTNTGYELMPIGHGLIPQKSVTKSNNDMRPFYAFTVPPVTRPELKDKVFDEISWNAILQKSTNEGGQREMILLDASKMAASKIDYSYSLWTPFSDDPNGKTVAYYGCFFGAERFEIGDALRIKAPPGEVELPNDRLVVGLRFIFTSKDVPGSVFFRGHLYRLVSGDVDHPNTVPDENLPLALRDECLWRNSVVTQHKWRWILVKENVVLKEQSIKGRFYPTHRLMPIMNPVGFQNAINSGHADQQFAHLNNRMDGAGRYLGRKRNRLDSLGPAVPHNVRFTFEQHIREEAFDQTIPEQGIV